MARSLQELEDQFDEASEKVPSLILKHTEGAALDALALVDLRISEKGIDSKGSAFKPYSKKKLPLFFFRNSDKVTRDMPLPDVVFDGPKKKGKRRKKVGLDVKYKSGITYQEYKMEVGRDVGHVNFSLTGQMLASTTTGFERIAPTKRSITNGKARIEFDGRDEHTNVQSNV